MNTNNIYVQDVVHFYGKVPTVELLYILKRVISKISQQKYRSENVTFLL